MATAEDSRQALRLALLAPGEIFGGAERQMLTLCAWLAAQSIRPRVILFHEAALAAALRRIGIEPIVLSGGRALSIAAARQLRHVLAEADINVLHFHGYKAAVHAWLATRSQPLCIVKTEHGAVETPGEALHVRGKTALYDALDTFATRRMRSEIVYVTKELERRFAAAHRGLRRSMIYNGVEPPATLRPPRPPEYRADRQNVLILGRLEQVKGIEHAVRALADPAMPPGVMLHVVGEGPLRGELEGLSSELGLSERIAFHGFRRNAQDYMAHADALLVSSLHEGLPYVLLEAMSLRAPVVATAVGGMQEVLKDGETALLVAPADPGAIARGLARLVATPALAEHLRAGAALLVSDTFSAATMGRQYLSLYQRVLAENTRRARA
jgi:L-malate glycosyltransferase